jgi:hypothetical protein
MNDTHIDTYNPVFEALNKIAAHTPNPLYQTEPVPQHTPNIHTSHIIDNRHTKM